MDFREGAKSKALSGLDEYGVVCFSNLSSYPLFLLLYQAVYHVIIKSKYLSLELFILIKILHNFNITYLYMKILM